MFCEVGEVVRASAPYTVDVHREDYETQDEVIVTHTASVAPPSPQSNALSLDVRRGVPDLLSPAPEREAVAMVSVDVRGPLQRLDQLQGFTAYVSSAGGGYQEARASRRGVLTSERDDLLRARVPEPGVGVPVRARLDFVDGSSTLTEAIPRGYTPYPLCAPLILEAVERPWAIEDGLPSWLVQVRLTGHDARLAEVVAMTLESVDEQGTRRALTVGPDGRSAEVRTSVPLHFEAHLTFDVACGRAPETLLAHATLATRHTAQPLELYTVLAHVDEVYVDPNAWDIHEGASEPVMHAVTALRGWERDLRRVRSVRYALVDKEALEYVDGYTPEAREVTDRRAERIGAFGMPYSSVYTDFDFDAVVTLDGADTPLELPTLTVNDDTFFQ